MFRINPINYFGNNYHLVRKNNKVKPISEVSKSNKDKGNDSSNSSNFKEILEEEIQKQKKKKI